MAEDNARDIRRFNQIVNTEGFPFLGAPPLTDGDDSDSEESLDRQEPVRQEEHSAPFPIHMSPLEGDGIYLEYDWQMNRENVESYYKRLPSGTRDRDGFLTTIDEKLTMIETYFWPALDRFTNGVYHRAHMVGMLDWYREVFRVTRTRHDARVAHGDGVWSIVIRSSPWFTWPEFQNLIWEECLDSEGNPILDGAGTPRFQVAKSACTIEAEERFLDLWETICNSRPLKRLADGVPVTPRLIGLKNLREFRSDHMGLWRFNRRLNGDHVTTSESDSDSDDISVDWSSSE